MRRGEKEGIIARVASFDHIHLKRERERERKKRSCQVIRFQQHLPNEFFPLFKMCSVLCVCVCMCVCVCVCVCLPTTPPHSLLCEDTHTHRARQSK